MLNSTGTQSLKEEEILFKKPVPPVVAVCVKIAMCKWNRAAKATVLVLVTVAFILVLSINYLSMLLPQLSQRIGLFPNRSMRSWTDRNNIKFNTTFTPAAWTFAIWGPIFIYQAVLIAYNWSTLFRRAYPNGPFLCSDPDLAPYGVLAWHFISSLTGVAWSVLAEWVDEVNELRIPQSAVLFAFAISLYLCLISSYWNLHRDRKQLISCNKLLDYWLVVGLVQNGVAMYATWCTIASFVNLNSALVLNAAIDETSAAIGCLAAVVGIVVAYAIADLTVLDIVTRFVFTPHLVVIWACAGSLARNFEAWSALTIMTIVLICLTLLALVVKCVLICAHTRSKPVLGSSAGAYQLQDGMKL